MRRRTSGSAVEVAGGDVARAAARAARERREHRDRQRRREPPPPPKPEAVAHGGWAGGLTPRPRLIVELDLDPGAPPDAARERSERVADPALEPYLARSAAAARRSPRGRPSGGHGREARDPGPCRGSRKRRRGRDRSYAAASPCRHRRRRRSSSGRSARRTTPACTAAPFFGKSRVEIAGALRGGSVTADCRAPPRRRYHGAWRKRWGRAEFALGIDVGGPTSRRWRSTRGRELRREGVRRQRSVAIH